MVICVSQLSVAVSDIELLDLKKEQAYCSPYHLVLPSWACGRAARSGRCAWQNKTAHFGARKREERKRRPGPTVPFRSMPPMA